MLRQLDLAIVDVAVTVAGTAALKAIVHSSGLAPSSSLAQQVAADEVQRAGFPAGEQVAAPAGSVACLGSTDDAAR